MLGRWADLSMMAEAGALNPMDEALLGDGRVVDPRQQEALNVEKYY